MVAAQTLTEQDSSGHVIDLSISGCAIRVLPAKQAHIRALVARRRQARAYC